MSERFVGTGQPYQYISEAIAASSNGDIVTITDGRTYFESLVNVALLTITIRSNKTDPDAFPIVKLFLDGNTLNMIDNWTFTKVILEPNGSLNFGQNLKTITFRQCVLRNYTFILSCDCYLGRVKTFESCLIYNISDYVFDAARNYGEQALKVKNCTFHACANIFKNDFGSYPFAEQPQISNCIFSECPGIASQVEDGPPVQGKRYLLFRQFRYCTLTNNPQTSNATLGTGCYVNESIAGIYQKTAKSVPSDFRIKDNPRIRNSGSDSLGFSPDLAGTARSSLFDRGAWEYESGGGGAGKFILPVIHYQGVP